MMTQSEKEAMLFSSLVMMFQTAALQHMGKIKNPVTDKVERNMEQAQFAIDMLDLLGKKMNEGMTEEEKRLITTVVRDLKLNYVDELAKESPQGAEPKDSPEPDDSKEPA